MASLTDTGSSASSATIVHRAAGGIAGLREVFDHATRMSVCAFPFAAIGQAATKLLATPACYLLADHRQVYIGESGNVVRRLFEHAADAPKAFAREVFVVSAFDDQWFDKTAAVYFQYRLTCAAESAGLIVVQKGTNPQLIELPPWRLAPLDNMVNDAQRLLFDAGCRAFHSNCDSQRPLPPTDPFGRAPGTMPDGESGEADDGGLMEIGVTTTPPGVEEYELNYGNLWARGYQSGDRFVVAAGSDIRKTLNPSVNPIIATRRDALIAADVLRQVPALEDRTRLMVAVAFPSMAIAAKVVCGAHVDSSKWQPLRYAQPVILAA